MTTHLVRTAVIGIGAMGRRHLQALSFLPVDVVAIADLSPAALDAAAAIVPLESHQRYSDPVRLLQEAHPELVVVSTTAPGHAPLTIEAARCGARYILCEKPMASSLSACDAMIEACQQHQAILAVNHGNRALNHYQTLKRQLSAGLLGVWRSLTIVMGNGGLANNATHYIDLFHFLTGEPITEVSAWLHPRPFPNPRGVQFVDYGGSARMESASGKRLMLEMSADLGFGVLFVFAGSCGRLVVDHLSGEWQLATRRCEDWNLPTTRYATPSVMHVWSVARADPIGVSRAMLQRLLAGETLVTGTDGRAAVAVLMAMHHSSRHGHVPTNPWDCRDLMTMEEHYA
jgi:predicted dehydrogenase